MDGIVTGIRFVTIAVLLCLAVQPLHSQLPTVLAPPPEPATAVPAGQGIQRDVNLVVLHLSVVDQEGKFVSGLTEKDTHVYEDGVQQKLAVAKQEDVPISLGLVIDSSSSMYDKRAGVNAAALAFVRSSNPEDETFVAHFNNKYHFDLKREFSSDISELSNALNQGELGGSTALYDAVSGSLERLRRGYKDKKVLLIISDGEDNASTKTFESILEQAKRSSAMIYAIGLLGREKLDSAQRAREALLALTTATGGSAFFPSTVEEVESICLTIAQDLRHQYTVGYYPTNSTKDGSFRSIRVEVKLPANVHAPFVRTRTGYFAGRLTSRK